MPNSDASVWADRDMALQREMPQHLDVLAEHWPQLPLSLRKAIIALTNANFEHKEIIDKFMRLHNA